MLATQQQIEAFIAEHSSWRYDRADAALCRDLAFGNFFQAIEFIRCGAEAAEQLDHHPEWSNVYNRVWVKLISHDAGGVTERDFKLAVQLERCAIELGAE